MCRYALLGIQESKIINLADLKRTKDYRIKMLFDLIGICDMTWMLRFKTMGPSR